MSHVLVACAKRYNGHELWTALGVLNERGHTFEVVSQATIIRDELTLRPNIIKRTVWDVKVTEVEDFDGIMIVSGNMSDTESYWDDKHVLSLVEAFDAKDKAVSAICCSVPTIRTVARNKKVSFYPLVRSRERLTMAGADLQTVAVSRDGNLVTAEHQMATQMWATAYCEVLEGLPPSIVLTDSGYMPMGRPRKPIPELERIKDIQRRTGRKGLKDEPGST